MVKQITHIRLKNSSKVTSENIIEVKLSTGETRTTETLIAYMRIGKVYYYTNEKDEVINIEVVSPLYKNSYIRSIKKEGITGDLLDLPHF